jgi:hypothetical protein
VSRSVTTSSSPAEPHFDRLPPESLVRAFGVDYYHVVPPEGGDLYVTPFGFSQISQLMPANWYFDEWYAREGEKLIGSTGHVYHVLSRPVRGKRADLVVKFSRVAQYVPLIVEATYAEDFDPETIAAARFNSPMEEFGLVMELRRGLFGPSHIQILTQRPLAIYAPPEEFKLWQLGRSTSSFHSHRRFLELDQEDAVKAIELDIKRKYVLLYSWIKGQDAEQFHDAGIVSESELHELTNRVASELRQKGFRVLDNKPKHFILRQHRRNASLMRRKDGELIYGLVDFELLQRTPEHQRQFKTMQQERYRTLQIERYAYRPIPRSSQLKPTSIFGVNYIYGTVQDGGHLWVVGRNPSLFDFFVPDRWRRTSRVKLSPLSEVYRTHTRDNIEVVYRRSRVGFPPRHDPLSEEGKRIRSHGYNSPFEEVVIAERLREMEIPTTLPLAIYRTGHASTKSRFQRDDRRVLDHADLLTPSTPAIPILQTDYDYYTLWDCFRGFSPVSEAAEAVGIDLEQAVVSALIDADTRDSIMDRIHRMLEKLGLEEDPLEESEVSVHKKPGSDTPCLDERGEVYATFSLDALTAFEIGLLPETSYKSALRALNTRLNAADAEKLDSEGNHLLLSFDADGEPRRDSDGELQWALCNFEFVRGLYRPIR